MAVTGVTVFAIVSAAILFPEKSLYLRLSMAHQTHARDLLAMEAS